MTRVLHLLCQRPGRTGSGIYLQAMIDCCRRAGIQQAAVVGLPAGAPHGLEGLPVHEVHFESPGLPFPVVGMSDVMPYRSTRWRDLSEVELDRYRAAFGSVLRRAARELQPGVVHSHHLWLVTALARELFPELRVVASCHGTGLRQLELVPRLASLVEPFVSRLDAVFALTADQRDQVVERFGLASERVVVTGAGFRRGLFRRAPSRVRRRVIYAGKLSRAKGVPWLLEAVRGLELELWLAGGGEGEERLEVEALAAEVKAKLLGTLSQEELAEVLAHADLFVLPSFYEGLPLVLMEALASGCRVVVNALPGVVSWLPGELVDSGWVELVDLPPLTGPDRPDPRGLPGYVHRLRAAISHQLARDELDFSVVEPVLGANTWDGVFERIKPHYFSGLG